jgi:SUKH-4 immunity protein of toxin-antitoxin system
MPGLNDILRAPVAELVVAEDQVLVAAGDVARWDVPDADRRALTNFGLPLMGDAGCIPEPDPGPAPKAFGKHSAYYLGIAKRLEVGAIPGSGRVSGFVAGDPDSDPAFFNSSISLYVASSWRYYWLARELGDEITLQSYDEMAKFLAAIVASDPAVGDDASRSWWPAVIEGW